VAAFDPKRSFEGSGSKLRSKGRFMQILLATALAILSGASLASTSAEAAQPPALNCDIGPLHKTYGQTAWLVYACNDSRSIVIVSDNDNPALPFYFMLFVTPSGDMQLHGQGTGKESATKAAFEEIKTLTESDIARLVEQARDVRRGDAIN
jgi:hypothetical protein